MRGRLRAGLRSLVVCAVVGVAMTAHGARAQAGRDSAAPAAPSDTAARRAAPAAGVVPADSLPSADARAVLRTVPEPLAPDEVVDAPDSVAQASPASAAPDTTAADTSGVPTPELTAPLGEGPGGPARNVFADSVLSAMPGSGAAAPGAGAASGGSAGGASRGAAAPGAAEADTCWRLQIAAPLDRDEAEARRAAAESQMLVPMVIDESQGRHKVRGRDCLSRGAAEALRARALLSGFDGAFLVRMGPGGAAIPAVAPAKRASSRTKGAGVRSGTSGSKKPATTKPPSTAAGTR